MTVQTQPGAVQVAEPGGDARLLITAAEVYRAMEHAFLDARHEIRASYRIFDLNTAARRATVADSW